MDGRRRRRPRPAVRPSRPFAQEWIGDEVRRGPGCLANTPAEHEQARVRRELD